MTAWRREAVSGNAAYLSGTLSVDGWQPESERVTAFVARGPLVGRTSVRPARSRVENPTYKDVGNADLVGNIDRPTYKKDLLSASF
jgi:hypothetical protein